MEAIKIHPADNVAVALVALSAGQTHCGVTLAQDIPAGHKFTLRDLRDGDNIIKYGFPTGHLTRPAPAGTLVDHTCIATNLSGLSEYTYSDNPDNPPTTSEPQSASLTAPVRGMRLRSASPAPTSVASLPSCGAAADAALVTSIGRDGSGQGLPQENRATLGAVRGGTVSEANGGVERSETFSGASPCPAPESESEFRRRQNCQPCLEFQGYKREDGQVGVRNYIWIIPTVGCVSGVAETLAKRMNDEIATDPGSVDGVVAFPHNYGCSQLGDDHENTRKILADLIHNPNAGGVLVVGLGCENNQPDAFMQLVGKINPDRVKSMVTQKVPGDEIEYGLTLLRQIFAACRNDRRTPTPVSELRIGLKCGGSDGLSGITANPLLGVLSDWLCAQGGTAVLTEVPEMFGAETLLMDRCIDRGVFDKTVAMINGFKRYFMAQGQPVYENPSPGNKAGGISTLEEKSLGCTQKSGTSPVCDVLEYGDRLRGRGLNLLSAPGNDLVASTALAAAGCQIVLFTTGRGTPFGSPVPTVKVSTNSTLAANKPGWIDFNAGVLAESETMSELFPRFRDYVLAVASGAYVNNEKSGWNGMAIFKTGVTL